MSICRPLERQIALRHDHRLRRHDQALRLTPDKAFVEPLYFDEEKVRLMPKTYIHCTQSEFVLVSTIFFERVIEECPPRPLGLLRMPSNHACMVSHRKRPPGFY